MSTVKFNQPFRHLMPPASAEDTRLLNASIAVDDVQQPILVTPAGEILAGHRRYDAKPDTTNVKVVEDSKDWSEAEKMAFVLKMNHLGARNLDADGRKHLRRSEIAVTLRLKAEGKTQANIAHWLGISQQEVSDLIHTGSGKNNKPQRKQTSTGQVTEIKKRLEQGESQSKVAHDLGLSQPTVSRIATGKTKGQPDKPTEESSKASDNKPCDSKTEATKSNPGTEAKPMPDDLLRGMTEELKAWLLRLDALVPDMGKVQDSSVAENWRSAAREAMNKLRKLLK